MGVRSAVINFCYEKLTQSYPILDFFDVFFLFLPRVSAPSCPQAFDSGVALPIDTVTFSSGAFSRLMEAFKSLSISKLHFWHLKTRSLNGIGCI